MHIALGVNEAKTFPIKAFLNAGSASNIKIPTEAWPPHFPASTLTFDGNPSRRGGEWRINDQAHHRHPAWTQNNGFPTTYDASNRPIVVIARVDGKYHVRFLLEADVPKLPIALSAALERNKGIIDIHSPGLSAINIPHQPTILENYQEVVEQVEATKADEYSPGSEEDARKRQLAEVVRRQGQQSFRKKLLQAYDGTCAITRTQVVVTLEAAHITPYLGPATNHISNGILLRADIHTLFDLALLSVAPTTHVVRVSSQLAGTEYAGLDGKKILLPKKTADRPSSKALEQHHKDFQA